MHDFIKLFHFIRLVYCPNLFLEISSVLVFPGSCLRELLANSPQIALLNTPPKTRRGSVSASGGLCLLTHWQGTLPVGSAPRPRWGPQTPYYRGLSLVFGGCNSLTPALVIPPLFNQNLKMFLLYWIAEVLRAKSCDTGLINRVVSFTA